jgi:hypothetical protein
MNNDMKINNIINDDNKENNSKTLVKRIKHKEINTLNTEIKNMKEKIKEKTDEIKNNIKAINKITKNKKLKSDYRKALLLAINLGFFTPKKTYSLFISSPFLYKNINKEIMVKDALKKLEDIYIELNYFVLQHVRKIKLLI